MAHWETRGSQNSSGPARRVGRPSVYASEAAKHKAFRYRQKVVNGKWKKRPYTSAERQRLCRLRKGQPPVLKPPVVHRRLQKDYTAAAYLKFKNNNKF